jgi:hypothetical protein
MSLLRAVQNICKFLTTRPWWQIISRMFMLPVVIQDLIHCSGAPRARNFPRGQHINTLLLIGGINRVVWSWVFVAQQQGRLSPKSWARSRCDRCKFVIIMRSRQSNGRGNVSEGHKRERRDNKTPPQPLTVHAGNASCGSNLCTPLGSLHAPGYESCKEVQITFYFCCAPPEIDAL